MGSGGGYAQGMESAHRPIAYRWLGRLGYDEAHAEQRRLVDDHMGGSGVDTFLALEHEPVLTLGKNATLAHLHLSEAEYAARGIAVRRVERGGEVTYHGPGHLVAYPIVNLRAAGISLRQHICALEDALIAVCTLRRGSGAAQWCAGLLGWRAKDRRCWRARGKRRGVAWPGAEHRARP